MTKRLSLFLVLVLALAASPLLAQEADTEESKTTTGSLELGVWSSSLTGSPDIVSRYLPADKTGPAGLFHLESHQEGGNIAFDSKVLDSRWQKHSLVFDVGRVLRSTTTYNRFLYRQGHDPLTNMEAVTAHGRVAWHTDNDPEAVYDLDNGMLEHRTEIQPSGLSALTLGVGYRDRRRSGAHQSRTVAHCDTCHVIAETHNIDEKMQEGSVDATVTWMKGYLKGELTRRQLRQETASVDVLYDRALHPELRKPLFDNRVQYDAVNGPLPIDHLHDADKNVGKLNLQLSDVGGFNVAAGGIWSSTENLFTNLKASYQGYNFNAARRFKKVTLRLRGRAYFLDNDDVFVDVVEPAGTAGPHAGVTFREAYDFDPDYTRQSSLNRDVYETNVDLSIKLGRKAGRLRGFWKFKSIDREYFEVAPGETRTATNILGLSWRPRLAKGLKLKGDYQHGSVNNPYMNLSGACSTLQAEGVSSPFDPAAGQYFEFQDARAADTTASPQSWNDVRLRTSYTKGRTNLMGSYRWRKGKNTSGSLTDWSRSNQVATVTLWSAPADRWEGFVAYSWQRLEQDSPACVPLFDG